MLYCERLQTNRAAKFVAHKFVMYMTKEEIFMKKKVLSLVLTAAMVMSLAACGSDKNAGGDANANT